MGFLFVKYPTLGRWHYVYPERERGLHPKQNPFSLADPDFNLKNAPTAPGISQSLFSSKWALCQCANRLYVI